MNRALTAVSLISLLILIPNRFSAETMEGDHIFILGLGTIRPLGLSFSQTMATEFDGDGSADFASISQEVVKASHIFGFQYYYHPSPRIGLGVNFSMGGAYGRGGEAPASIRLSGGTIQAGSQNFQQNKVEVGILQIIPSIRYLFRPDHRINPFLSGGIGINRISVRSSAEYRLPMDMPGPPVWYDVHYVNRDFHAKTSLGLAVSIGCGLQAALWRDFSGGVEGRWIYSRADQEPIGVGPWRSLSGYGWVGWKWRAPL